MVECSILAKNGCILYARQVFRLLLLFVDERYIPTALGLRIIDVVERDRGEYICRAEVEIDGRYDERRINVSVHG